MNWFVYIAACSDGTLYTGITTDVDRRMAEHNAGRGSKYARSRLPVRAVWLEAQPDKGKALSREYAIKQLSRAQKMALIESCDQSGKARPGP